VWLIQDFSIREVTLGIGDADFRPIHTSGVYCGDVCLINATTLCDFSTDPCQLTICHCGEIGCSSSGYVSFRRIGEFVAMIPAFKGLGSDDEHVRSRHEPPMYFDHQERNGAVFDREIYSALQARVPELPVAAEIPRLFATEAISLIQLAAPLQVLGSFPDRPTLKKNLILAVTLGDVGSEINAVNSFITAVIEANARVDLAGPSEEWTPIEFHLNEVGFPSWTSFKRSGDQMGILLEPCGVLVVGS
jgi:hypothetical protein